MIQGRDDFWFDECPTLRGTELGWHGRNLFLRVLVDPCARPPPRPSGISLKNLHSKFNSWQTAKFDRQGVQVFLQQCYSELSRESVKLPNMNALEP